MRAERCSMEPGLHWFGRYGKSVSPPSAGLVSNQKESGCAMCIFVSNRDGQNTARSIRPGVFSRGAVRVLVAAGLLLFCTQSEASGGAAIILLHLAGQHPRHQLAGQHPCHQKAPRSPAARICDGVSCEEIQRTPRGGFPRIPLKKIETR